ncbi:hypothetical protein DSECCO2_542960 [anaerobic digester metagenome]
MVSFLNDDVCESDEVSKERETHYRAKEFNIIVFYAEMESWDVSMYNHHHGKRGSQIAAQSHKYHSPQIQLQMNHDGHSDEVQHDEADLDDVPGVHLLESSQDFCEESEGETQG